MKTTEQIFDEIIAEKQSGNYVELDTLNSTSKVSIWRLWVWIFSFFTKALYEVFESFKTYTEEFFSKNQVGTLNWWIDTVSKFQYGDVLEFIDNKFQYSVNNTEKQIVKRVAVSVQDNVLEFKLAKLTNGTMTALSGDELSAVESYINRIKPVGTYISVNSTSADNLKVEYRIYYNAQYSVSALQENIEKAVNTYLSDIVFNASLSVTEMTDVIQQVAGVINPIAKNIQAKAFFEVAYTAVEDYYQAVAGYYELTEITLELIPKN